MNIRFVSTLTAEDENQFAPALLSAVTALLDSMPIAYTLRVQTLDGSVFQHSHPASSTEDLADHARASLPLPSRRRADA